MPLFAPMARYVVLAIGMAAVSVAVAVMRDSHTAKVPQRRISLLLRLLVLVGVAWLHVVGYMVWQLVSTTEVAQGTQVADQA